MLSNVGCEFARRFQSQCTPSFPKGVLPPVSRLDGPKGEGMSWRLSLGFLEEVSKGLRKIDSVLRGPRGQGGGRRIGLV